MGISLFNEFWEEWFKGVRKGHRLITISIYFIEIVCYEYQKVIRLEWAFHSRKGKKVQSDQ